VNDRQWDDYIRKQPGTFWGEMGREHAEAMKPKPLPTPNRPTRRKARKASRTSGVTSSAGEGWLPGIDRWFDEHLSIKARRRFALLLTALGAMVGLGAAHQLGLGAGLAALLGAAAGLVLLPLLMVAVKVVITALFAGAVLGILYALGVAFGLFG
jgi:hypothetical protein